MARHDRHRSVDDYPPYHQDRYASPWGPHPPSPRDRDAERYRRRPEPAYHDDRWGPAERPQGRQRAGYRRSPSPPPAPLRSRRGQSEAPSRSTREPPYSRSRDPEPMHPNRGLPLRSRDRAPPAAWDQDAGRGAPRHGRSLGPEHRYPPRSADTRPGRPYPGPGAAGATSRGPRGYYGDDDDDDDRAHAPFGPPGRSRTLPPHMQHDPRVRGSHPPRGRPRGRSPGPYHSGGPPPMAAAAIPRSRTMGRPPTRSPRRSRSMPAPHKADESAESNTKSRAQKAATYAAMGAVARVALQAGAQTAYKLRDDPSPWVGEKGIRVATAALGAGIADGIVGRRHSKMKRGGMRHQAMRQAAELGIRQFVVHKSANAQKR